MSVTHPSYHIDPHPSGTFLTAHPSGTLTASAPSRGPLEAFKPEETLSEASPFPTFAIQTQSEKYISIDADAKAEAGPSKRIALRADADSVGPNKRFTIKCQREFVYKARVARQGKDATASRKRTAFDRGAAEGSVEDELRRKCVLSIALSGLSA